MKVSNGYQLYPDGEIFAKVPKWEYGFNRFRFLASYCATAVFKFDEATYGELAKNLVIEIGCKINAMRYGFYDLSYPGGYGIFVFDGGSKTATASRCAEMKKEITRSSFLRRREVLLKKLCFRWAHSATWSPLCMRMQLRLISA